MIDRTRRLARPTCLIASVGAPAIATMLACSADGIGRGGVGGSVGIASAADDAGAPGSSSGGEGSYAIDAHWVAWLVLALPAISLAGLALTVLHKETK